VGRAEKQRLVENHSTLAPRITPVGRSRALGAIAASVAGIRVTVDELRVRYLLLVPLATHYRRSNHVFDGACFG